MTEKSAPSEIFRERVKTARELRKWSQIDLAGRAGLPPSSIAHFEAGSRKPSFDTLRRLANALEVTTDYLLGRVNEPGLAEAGDPLFRDVGKLTGRDRELAKDFLQMLAERGKAKMTKAPSPAFRLKMAKQKAEALLRDEGITTLPVDPFAIAANRGIEVRPKPEIAAGVSGMLLRHGNVFGILYATNIPSEGFQRFSVGHELGHYFLEGHIDHILPEDGVHESRAGFVSADPYELEADQFAAGLLMPSAPFERALARQDSGLEIVKSLATLCRTSLTATAIRYAELTDDAVAVIISTGPVIDFCFLSDTMKSLPELTWVRKGTPVPKSTVTAQINADPGRIASADHAEADIDIMDWLGGKHSIRATEQAVGLGRYGKTLTVLTCPSVQDETYREDEGENDEDLAEHWTPRFRR